MHVYARLVAIDHAAWRCRLLHGKSTHLLPITAHADPVTTTIQLLLTDDYLPGEKFRPHFPRILNSDGTILSTRRCGARPFPARQWIQSEARCALPAGRLAARDGQ